MPQTSGITPTNPIDEEIYTYGNATWGNHTVTYSNNGNSIVPIVSNPLRYRGYYYDVGLGLYYLQTRYYDSNIGRFINADTLISGVNGSLHGYNLYAYCFNNPVSLNDFSGNWPDFLDALLLSMEVKVGVGFGLGWDIPGIPGFEISRDTYIGIDDGVAVTGNQISLNHELSFSGFNNFEITVDHLVEKNGQRVSDSAHSIDGPLDMVAYSDAEYIGTIKGGPGGLFWINSEGEFLIGADFGFHVGGGFSASVAFNVSEFLMRSLFGQ